MQLKKLSVGPGVELCIWRAREQADSLGNAEWFNLVVTSLQVCGRCKTVLFPMVMLTEISSADPLDEGFRWQVVVGSGTLAPCCFGQRSVVLPMFNRLDAGWSEKPAAVSGGGDSWHPGMGTVQDQWSRCHRHTAVQR